MTGTTTSQVVFESGADDRIDGFGKDDHLHGESGNATMDGRGGNDQV